MCEEWAEILRVHVEHVVQQHAFHVGGVVAHGQVDESLLRLQTHHVRLIPRGGEREGDLSFMDYVCSMFSSLFNNESSPLSPPLTKEAFCLPESSPDISAPQPLV